MDESLQQTLETDAVTPAPIVIDSSDPTLTNDIPPLDPVGLDVDIPMVPSAPTVPSTLTLLEFLTKRLNSTSPIPSSYIYTSSFAILFSLFLSFVVNYKKQNDEEKYIQEVLRPKLIESICKNIEKDNEDMEKYLEEKRVQKEKEKEELANKRLKSSESMYSQETLTNERGDADKEEDKEDEDAEKEDQKTETELKLQETNQQVQSLTQENIDLSNNYNNNLVQSYQKNQQKLQETTSTLSNKKSNQDTLSEQVTLLEKTLLKLKENNKEINGKVGDQKKLQRKHNDLKSRTDRKSVQVKKDIEIENKKISVLKEQVVIEDQSISQKNVMITEKDNTLYENESKIEDAKRNFNSLNKSFNKLNANAKLSNQEKLNLLTESSEVELELEAVKEEIASLQYIFETNEEDYKVQLAAHDDTVKMLKEKKDEKMRKEEDLRRKKTRLRVSKDFYGVVGGKKLLIFFENFYLQTKLGFLAAQITTSS